MSDIAMVLYLVSGVIVGAILGNVAFYYYDRRRR